MNNASFNEADMRAIFMLATQEIRFVPYGFSPFDVKTLEHIMHVSEALMRPEDDEGGATLIDTDLLNKGGDDE